jgi:hypothetical protein
MFQPLPFASKELPDGKKLFRRVHGFKVQLVANGDAVGTFTIPYASAKINEAEIVNAPAGLTVDFEVLDTDQGTIQISKGVPPGSAVPNLMLDKFGHDVNVAAVHYNDKSPYDADVIQGMKIRVTLKNPTNSTDLVGVNIVVHEVK